MQVQHDDCRGKSADERLPLRAGIPETHPERGRHREGNAEQDCNIVNRHKGTPLAECTLPHGFKHGERVVSRTHNGEDRADHERRENRDGANADRLLPTDLRPLRYMEKGRFFDFFRRLFTLGRCRGFDRGILIFHLRRSLPFWSSSDRFDSCRRFCRLRCRTLSRRT